MSEQNKELLEEYKLCVKRVQALDKNIWQTATLFGIGNIVGFISAYHIAKSDYKFMTLLVVVAIGISLVWWRLARRWWSIQNALLNRMEQIEREKTIKLRSNLYIKWLDHEYLCMDKLEFTEDESSSSPGKPFYPKSLREKIGNYEHRGIQPLLKFLKNIIICGWIFLIIIIYLNFDLVQVFKNIIDKKLLEIITVIAFIITSICLYLKKSNSA
jgi:hypothetical protein